MCRGHSRNGTVVPTCVDAREADGRHQAMLAIEPPARHRNTRPVHAVVATFRIKDPAWLARRWRS